MCCWNEVISFSTVWGHTTFVCESEGTYSNVTPSTGNLWVLQDWDAQTSYLPDFSTQIHTCGLSAIQYQGLHWCSNINCSPVLGQKRIK